MAEQRPVKTMPELNSALSISPPDLFLVYRDGTEVEETLTAELLYSIIGANAEVDTNLATDQLLPAAFNERQGIGRASVALTDSDVTLTAAQYSRQVINIGDTLTGDRAVIFPNDAGRWWLVRNNTSGAFSVTLKTAAGTGVTIAQGGTLLIQADGTNIINVNLTGAPEYVEVDVTGTGPIMLTEDQALARTIKFIGTSGGDREVSTPTDQAYSWLIINNDTGGNTITFKTSTGTGVEFSQEGEQRNVRSDGTDMVNDYSAHYETGRQVPIDISGSTNVNATEDQISGDFIPLNGTSTGDHDVTWPNDVAGIWVVQNNDDGGFTMTVKTATGTGVDLLGGGRKYLIRSDGTDMSIVATLNNATGAVISREFTSTSSVISTTAALPYDDTIPQITEGAEALSITFTPKRSDTRLRIFGNIFLRPSSPAKVRGLALFDGSTDAIAAVGAFGDSSDPASGFSPVSIIADIPSTGAEITISARFGANDASAMYVNATNSGGRRYGGVAASTLEILEYTA